MNTDTINGLFEFIAAGFLIFNCFKIYKDKCIRGVCAFPFVIYTIWGFWNLFFYPSVGCWLSFFGGICVVCINSIYCLQLWHYRKR